MRLSPDPIKSVADSIHADGYTVVQTFLDADAISALTTECRGADLQPTAMGHGATRADRADLRGDRTKWLHVAGTSSAQRAYVAAMDALRTDLNRELMLGLDELEAHFAMYAPGACYARHRDRFRDDDARVLSSVLYLNQDWRESDGGALRLYLQHRHLDVYPSAGKLVLFLTRRFRT